ncbi:conjugal transfer mating pair stabilization protein TraN [Sphingobium sp. B1D7B]|uniref:conjugal transfer protein TraN n=1 Tax=Sphingobium sp. B1D7B TaxID=2940578 RepID=UPI002224A915|nr:conjugal transfer protein TraN [Sphingobium sp. B1D7B]MCW2406883.1 conjugal transfer mating pair stabilization protein TraN [Sphingobium sp. B1D7B]
MKRFALLLPLILIAGAQAQTGSMQSAQNDGSQFAKDLAPSAAEIPGREVTTDTMPGYQGTPSDLSGLMGGSDDKLMSASGAAGSNEAYNFVRAADATRGQIDPSEIESIAARGRDINDDAASIAGIDTANTQSQCEPVTQQGSPATYEASCNAGSSVAVSDPVSLMECPQGWQLEGSTCQRIETQPAQPVYSCPSGYSLSGSTCTRSVAATVTYSCPTSYTLSGTTCTSTVPATITGYTCPSGWSLSGTTCTQGQTQSATVSGYVCPADYVASGNKCLRTISQSSTPVYSCPAGWNLSGNSCSQTGSYGASVSYGCPDGFTLSGTTCTATISQPGTPGYQCAGISTLTIDNGRTVCSVNRFNVGGKCPATFVDMAFLYEKKIAYAGPHPYCFYAPRQIFTCPGGYWQDDARMCHASRNQGASETWSCPSGGTLSGTTCIINNVTSATATQTCPIGYSLSGTTCSTTLSQDGTPKYTCPAGYSLSSSTCSRTASQPAAPQYGCSAGYALSGSQCTSSSSATANYSCQTGYKRGGQTCTTSQAGGVNYACPSGFTLNGQICERNRVEPATSFTGCAGSGTLSEGKCITVTEGESDCESLSSNSQCQWLRDDCLDPSPGETCKVRERVYRCPVPDSAQTETSYICSGDMWCMNGSCQTVEREASDEFKDALVAMGAMDQVGEDFDPDKLQLFDGTAESCHKPIFGAINCCAGKSSGLLTGAAGIAAKLALGTGPGAIAAIATPFLTMFACSNEEKSLDVKDRMGLCHSVGSFCTESVLGVCTTKRKAHCCYQSKLTRIIQEQGRPQIGKDWGTPKAPMCGGFTPDEFAKLDLSQMDFSEIYADMLEAVQLPDQAKQASDIQNKIRDYYDQTSGGTH